MENELSTTEIIEQEQQRFMSNFYRDRFRKCAHWLFVFIALNAILILVLFYFYLVLPKTTDTFYASNMYNGSVLRLYPLSAPVLQSKKLLSWSEQTAVSALTFNYVNYRDALSELQKSFTTEGWQEFNNVLTSSGILTQVTNQQLFLTASQLSEPLIVSDGVINGHYAWNISIPLLLDYKYSTTTSTTTPPPAQKKVTVNLIVVRVPNLDAEEDIAIDHFDIS